ncbi:MAG TPA: hypothetical protein VEC99_07735 [Clostridia bacterium]|nr:hypothetical protein [Clostridia bacterium]
MPQSKPIEFNTPKSAPLDATFSPDEVRALEWFRRQYWEGDDPAKAPDDAIAFMLLRVALGHPDRLVAWIDEMIHYREAEGVSLSELIDRKIAQRPEYRDKPSTSALENDAPQAK